ncbi:MAG: hypothetical protein PWP19_1181 [Thermococcaceae archaeon]|uniref:DUF262 domain-containing protein n=1 Tax=Pyrococcus sp. TaxID=33866 RepID=UPI00258DE14D|nr:DUF262 domain-containing protein [Pyrococcus sp.]MDK2870351.1 hypothetical protein [Pyrococcus sp.]MDK2983703.1 hypothetical protein [Thermococcaceae archaeon]
MGTIRIDVDKREIKELIPELESGKYRIPSFQRQYVWDEDDIKDLIDSIVNNYPIGTIILWKPSNSSLAEKIDPFSKPLIDSNGKKPSEIFYVIDGQQRLTSLLLLFKGWEISRGGEKITCSVPITYNPANQKFYKSKTRGIDLSNLIKAFWLKDKEMLRKLMDETPSEQFDDMMNKIDRILNYKLPIYVMETYEENEETFLSMAEAFIRVNKYGVRIGNLELMLSFLAGAISGELKERIHELYEDLYGIFEIDLQPVLRFAFSNFGLRQTQVSKVNQFKANIKKINTQNADTIFEKSKKSMKLAIDLLRRELGISNSRLLPSQIPLITISKYLYYKDVSNLEELEEDDVKNMINWFILASFNGYYSSATDTKLDEDLEIVKSSNVFPIGQLLENMKRRKAKIKISENDIKRGLTINVLRREGRAHLFLLYVLLVKNNADNWNGQLLKHSSLNELSRHHIFPKEYLEKELNIDDPDDREIMINNLGNITFIHKHINSEIGDAPPIDYLDQYVDYAKKHFIPIDKNLWKLEQYQTFLDYRIKEIYSTGKKVFNEIFE